MYLNPISFGSLLQSWHCTFKSILPENAKILNYIWFEHKPSEFKINLTATTTALSFHLGSTFYFILVYTLQSHQTNKLQKNLKSENTTKQSKKKKKNTKITFKLLCKINRASKPATNVAENWGRQGFPHINSQKTYPEFHPP